MVPPEGRKHCQTLPTDILINLPDNVIDVILCFLPSEDGVRTSILSKKWRYRWRRLKHVTLDASLWDAEKDLPDPRAKFSKFLYEFLPQHEGPITKFTLDITTLESCPEIDYFIHFLSRNGIQHLILQFPRNVPCKVPPSIFSCLWLRHLTLHDCLVLPPSTFKGSFDMLISLKLYRVTTSSGFLASLISQSPLLEQLVLKVVEVSGIIEINAPLLRSFKYKGRFSSISLKNVPLLSKLRMKRVRNWEPESFDGAKFFESCSSLENLRLQFYYYEDALLEDVPPRLPFDLNSVKRFCLPAIELENSHKLSCVLCLLRSFPHLEYLEIEIYNNVEDEEDAGVQDSLELERFTNVTFNHLKEVKLDSFSGTTPEMQIIKLLLAKSPVLVKMLIVPYANNDPDTRLKTLDELSKFCHASPKAELVYL